MLIVETDLPELLEEKRLIVKALIPLSERILSETETMDKRVQGFET